MGKNVMTESSLKVTLQQIDAIRKRTNFWRRFISILFAIPMVPVAYLQIVDSPRLQEVVRSFVMSYLDTIPPFLDSLLFQPYVGIILLVIPALFIYGAQMNYTGDKARKLFKEKVVPRIVEEVSPDLSYSPQCDKSIYFLSEKGLLDTTPNNGYSEDYFSGKLGATDVEFFEQRLVHVMQGDDRQKVTWLFTGLVFIADFHKSFKGTTLIIPDKGTGSMKSWFEKRKIGEKDIVKLENAEFEKIYTVYGTDQVEARYILSTSFMQRMVELYHKLAAVKNPPDRTLLQRLINREKVLKRPGKPKIKVLFEDEKMHMAIDWSNNFFDYNLKKKPEDEVRETAEEIRLISGIVEDLNLNTRIWSKT